MRLQLKDLMRHYQRTNRPLIDSTKSYLLDYENNYEDYDILTLKKYGNLILDTDYDTISNELIKEMDMIISGVIRLNNKKYEKLLEALSQEFSPIENYDRYEDITNTEGTRTDSNTYDVIKHTDTYGAKHEKTTNGQVGITTSYDDTHTDVTIGETSNSVYNKTAGINTEDAVVKDVTDTEVNSQTNSTDTDAYDVTTTTDSHDVDVNTDQYINMHKEDGRTDSMVKGQQVNTTVSHIHGNIGVTTSTSMVLEFASLYDKLNFMNVILLDVVNAITIPMFGGGC